jgi:parvulin-like peptidyl-prolyl isomerase
MANKADQKSAKKKPVEEEEDEREPSDLEEDEEEDEASEDEDEDEDEEDEEDEEEPPVHTKSREAPPKAEAPDTNWWIPHAILGTLILVGVLGFFGAFTSSLGPLWQKVRRGQPAASASAAPSAPASAPAAAPKPPAAPVAKSAPATAMPKAPVDPANPTFGARRILVAFKGAKNSQATRTKEEAKTRAEDAAKKLASGAKFEDVAAEFSDDAGSKTTGGNLGRFKRDAYDPAITGAVEKLQVGGTSAVFESPFGWEILTRTE